MCGGVRYWHPPRILAPTFCRRSSPLSTPHTAAFKRYDSFNDRDFVEKSDFQNLGFKLYWLDILLHPVLCGIFWLEKLRFFFQNNRSADCQLVRPCDPWREKSKVSYKRSIWLLWVSKWPRSSSDFISGHDESYRWRHDQIMMSLLNCFFIMWNSYSYVKLLLFAVNAFIQDSFRTQI